MSYYCLTDVLDNGSTGIYYLLKMNKYSLVLRLVGVGFFIGISIVLGVLAGIWLDSRFGTQFIWIIGLLAGLITALTGVYQMLKPLMHNGNKGDR